MNWKMNRNAQLFKQAEILQFMVSLTESGIPIMTNLELCKEQYPDYELEFIEIQRALEDNESSHGDSLMDSLTAFFDEDAPEIVPGLELDPELLEGLTTNLESYSQSFPKGFAALLAKGFSLGIYNQEIKKLSEEILAKGKFSVPDDYRESKETLFYRFLGENMKGIEENMRRDQRRPSKGLVELLQTPISDKEHEKTIREGRRNIQERNAKVIEALKSRNVSDLKYPSQEVYQGLVDAVGNGDKLSNAMMFYSRFFPNYQIKLIECAEDLGDFSYVLPKLTNYLRLKEAIEQKIRSGN